MLTYEFIVGHPPFESESHLEVPPTDCVRYSCCYSLPLQCPCSLCCNTDVQEDCRGGFCISALCFHGSARFHSQGSGVCMHCCSSPGSFAVVLFASQLLRRDPADRMSLGAVSSHPWIMKHSVKAPTSDATAAEMPTRADAVPASLP